MRRYRLLWLAGFLVTAGLVGYWLAGTAEPRRTTAKAEAPPAPPSHPVAFEEEGVATRSHDRKPEFRQDDEALAAGALPGQRVLIFKDRESLEKFLKNLGPGVKLLGRIDQLDALHVSFLNSADLLAMLDDSVESGFIFPAWLPQPGNGVVQDGAVGVGANLLQLLGVNGDNSQWGKGVWAAVLDTGVSNHSSIAAMIRSINLVPMSSDPAAWNGHGTAVASLMAGRGGLTPGLAPGLEGILSIRIGDDKGYSNSPLIAQGIVAAVDSGAKIINISFGSNGDSPIVRKAVEYAQKAGAVIVAAAGNNGAGQLSYPAANAGVIAVGAVDRVGSAMAFSNGGMGLSVMTYGYEVNAAWTNNEAVAFTGTSASAPILAGAIAAAMNPGYGTPLTAQKAVQLILSKLNDAGAPGWDPVYGYGLLDMDRVMKANTRGIRDAALASNYLAPAGNSNPYPTLQIVTQNRGTENLVNSKVTAVTPYGTVNYVIPNLAVNQINTYNIPLKGVNLQQAGPLRFDSSVSLTGQWTDANAANNRRAETYTPTSK